MLAVAMTSDFKEMRTLKDENERLRKALEERKLVDKAKGILMRNEGIPEDEAYRRIQKHRMDKRKNIKEGEMMLRRLLIGILFMLSLTMPMLAVAEEQAAQPEAATEAAAALAPGVPKEIIDKIAAGQIAGATAWVLASSALVM